MRIESVRRFVIAVPIGLCLATNVARADFVWQPTAASTNMGVFNNIFNIDFTISQIGLTNPYISGVTDASTYSSTHNDIFDEWQSQVGIRTGFVTYDLGAVVAATGMFLWNSSWSTGGNIDVNQFTLFSDDDNDPFNGTTADLGTFNAAETGGPHPMQTFDFATTPTRFVHMEILTNHGSPTNSGFSEVAFIVVPGPASLGLLGCICLGLGNRRRRGS